MNQTIKLISTLFPYVVLILMLIADYYEYSKIHDPKTADKLKHLGEFAEWAVAYQAKQDKTGQQKFDAAVRAVMDQAKKSQIPVTEQTVKNVVEAKVVESQPEKPLKAEDIAAGTVTGMHSADTTPEPVQDDNAALDDLKVPS